MMQPGPVVRRLFGPFEYQVAEAYRHIFVDLNDFGKLISGWVPQASRILEVGCGEGAMTERLTRIYPNANITAIDITPKVGRLFRGDRSKMTFTQEAVEVVASRQPASFDLVVLADVIHHVPADFRRSIFTAIEQSMTPGASFIFKDWIISKTPIHWLCGLSDRYLTGDSVSYCTMAGMKGPLIAPFEPRDIRQVGTVRPWNNNVAVLIQR